MVREAEANAADDKKKRELVEARNRGDSLLYQTEKTMTDLGEKLPAAERQSIESAIQELKSALSAGRSGNDQEQDRCLATGCDEAG